MSTEEKLDSLSFKADSSVGIYTGVPGQPGSASPNGGKQYCFVKLTAVRTVGLCTAATDLVVGILQNKPQRAGDAATVGYRGQSNVVSGAAVTANTLLAPDSAGRAVTDATNGKWIALEAAAAANVLIPALRIL